MLTQRILVVDDENDVQQLFPFLFRRQIRSQQYAFLYASSGKEALDLLEEDDYIDLILCDIDMPGMSGLEFLEIIQEQRMNVPIIMVSAHSSDAYIQAAMDAGAYEYVSKPFVLPELKTLIHQVVGESSPSYEGNPATRYLRRQKQNKAESHSTTS